MLNRVLRYGPLAGLALLFAFPEALAHLPDSWWGLPPFFALFLCFAVSLLGWGDWLAARFGLGAAGALLGASVAAVAFPMLLSPLHLLSARWIYFLALAPGAWMGPRLRIHCGRAVATYSRSALALFLAAGFIRFLAAYVPQAHGDPLLYHLVGPRLWEMAGTARLSPDLPNAILASSWEYFYVWPAAIWPDSASLYHLLAAQVFCQWIHLFWGWLGLALVVERLARPLPIEDRWRFLVPLAALFPASLQWTSGLAKNDAGIALWALGFWLCIEDARRSRRPALWVAAGVLAGLAVSGKINAVLFLGPALVVSLAGARAIPRLRDLLLLGAGALAAAVPIYLRNWLETGSPVFPMFPGLFPSPWLSRTWMEHFSVVQPGEAPNRFAILLVRLKELWRESPLLGGWALLPILLLLPAARARLRAARDWIFVGGISAAGFILAFGLDAEIRYLGAGLVVLAGAGLMLFLAPVPPRFRSAAHWLLLLLILASSKLPTHLLWKFSRTAPGAPYLLTHTGGDAKAWLREHTPPGALVVMMGDNESYYLLGMRVTIVSERPDLDEATRSAADLKAYVRAVCSLSGATYFLESRPQIGLAHRFPAEAPGYAVAFKGQSGLVYDLRLLESRLFPGEPPGCGRVPAPVYAGGASSR